jgi:hypothetical protein
MKRMPRHELSRIASHASIRFQGLFDQMLPLIKPDGLHADPGGLRCFADG